MNLNEFVPTHLEDASPVDEHQTVFLLSGRFQEEDKQDEFIFRPDIRYGVNKHIQLEAMTDVQSGGEETRSGETKLALQYMINEVKNAIPVFAICPFVAFPTGKKSAGLDIGAKFILSSTLSGTAQSPETQVHLNYQIRHNASRLPGERSEENSWAFGFSRLLSEKLVVVGDILFQEESEKTNRQDYVEAGFHQEFSEDFLLSYGLGKGFSHSSPDWMGILSFEYLL